MTSKYATKPDTCKACPWYDASTGYAAPTGPSSAKFAIVIENASENEAQQGVILAGWAGQQVSNLLKNHGISREEVYCDSVVRCKPPASGKKKEKLPKDIIEHCTSVHLRPALRSVTPNCILALGDHSLKWLTGFKGIGKYRGSLLRTEWGKVVPTFHPNFFVKGESAQIFWPFVDFDFGKAIEESQTATYTAPEENFNVRPSLKDVFKFVRDVKQTKRCSIDIETSGGSWWNTAPLCIGACTEFEPGRYRAISIPFYGYRGAEEWTADEWPYILKSVDSVLSDPEIEKVMQNALYDVQVLESIGFRVC